MCDESRPGVTSDCYVLGGLIDIYCRFLEYNDRLQILLHRCFRNGFSLETQQVAKFEIKKKTPQLEVEKKKPYILIKRYEVHFCYSCFGHLSLCEKKQIEFVTICIEYISKNMLINRPRSQEGSAS